MVKVVIELEIPNLIFDSFCGLYPKDTKEHLEKLVKDHNSWGVKAKILEMPKMKDVKDV